MLKTVFLYFILLSVRFCTLSAVVENENSVWIAWDTPEGISRIERSTAKANFWKIARFYECQIKPTYCGIASSVIALNCLLMDRSKGVFFEQSTLVSLHPEAINNDKLEERGLPLHELEHFLQAFPIKVQSYSALNYTDEEILSVLIAALKDPCQIVLGLYRRTEMKQEWGGHWSPVAAYDEVSHSFLVMDVARWKYPPVWVNADAFIQALKTTNILGVSRGFLILEK